MATSPLERNTPVLIQTGETAQAPDTDLKPARPKHDRFGVIAMFAAGILAALWAGATAAYLWGYFGPQGLKHLDIQQIALFVIATFVPPTLFVAAAWALARGHEMSLAAHALVDATD